MIATALVVAYFLALFIVMPRIHDSALGEFSRGPLDIELPEGTSQIASMNRVGLLQGNGNHCDYLAGSLVKTDASKEELTEYFAQNYKGEGAVQIVWLDEESVYTGASSSPATIFALRDWIMGTPQTATGTAVVFAFRTGLTSSFDYRCR